MTATVTNRPVGRLPEPMNGDSIAYHRRNTPGTLWERVAEGHAVYRSPRPYSAADKVQLAARLERAKTSRRFTLEEVATEFGLTAELELARAKAAHPAGKGITHEEVQ